MSPSRDGGGLSPVALTCSVQSVTFSDFPPLFALLRAHGAALFVPAWLDGPRVRRV